MIEKIKLVLNKINSYFLIFLISIFGFKFSFLSNVNSLDPSWVWAINYVSATDIYTWGKDVFFTYGPLGYLIMPALVGNNTYLGYLFYFVLFFTFIGTLIYVARNIKSHSSKLGFLLLLFILTFLLSDIFLFVPVFLEVLYWFSDKNKQKKESSIFFSLAVIFSLINLVAKTNLGVASLITLFFAFITVSIENKKINFKHLLLGFLYLILFLILMIVLYFGDLSTLINWLKVSLMIAAGYTEGMVVIGKWSNQFLLFNALSIIIMFLYIFKENFKAKTQYANVGIILLPYLFFQFKSGFVRQDLHMLVFYQTVLFIVSILLLLGEIKTDKNKKISLVILFFALILPLTFNSFNPRFNIFSSTKSLIEAHNKKMNSSNDEIPSEWVKTIGKSKVEILPFDFPPAIKYNLNIQFNPILQLYSVYTSGLDKISAQSFKVKNAPKYLLIHDFLAIDLRNMFFASPATWTSIKENYEVLSCKGRKMLLQKREKALKTDFYTYKEDEYKFNEQIYVPKGAKKALIITDLSLLGKITNFVFRLSPFTICINDNEGNTYKYRQVRDVLKNGLYLDSFATDIYQLDNWFENIIPNPQIKNFILHVRHPIFYSGKIKVEWQR